MTTNTVPGISALQCVISSLRDTAHLSDEGGELTDQLRELRDWALSTAAQPPTHGGDPAPAALAGPLNELEELNLLNKLIHLGARAASAHAKSNSDDGQAGTAAYVEWTEIRAYMRELIRKAYAAPDTDFYGR
jgi:hypothetical protein